MSRADVASGRYTSRNKVVRDNRPRRDEEEDDTMTLSCASLTGCCTSTCLCLLFLTTVLFAALFGWAYMYRNTHLVPKCSELSSKTYGSASDLVLVCILDKPIGDVIELTSIQETCGNFPEADDNVYAMSNLWWTGGDASYNDATGTGSVTAPMPTTCADYSTFAVLELANGATIKCQSSGDHTLYFRLDPRILFEDQPILTCIPDEGHLYS